MPDVRITATSSFMEKVKDEDQFCRSIRAMIYDLFQIALPNISVKLESYAPGCEEGRPPLVISVSIGQGSRAPADPGNTAAQIASYAKLIADKVVCGDAGKVKAVFDVVTRKTATAEL